MRLFVCSVRCATDAHRHVRQINISQNKNKKSGLSALDEPWVQSSLAPIGSEEGTVGIEAIANIERGPSTIFDFRNSIDGLLISVRWTRTPVNVQ